MAQFTAPFTCDQADEKSGTIICKATGHPCPYQKYCPEKNGPIVTCQALTCPHCPVLTS